nr:unnamed protein product [Callosobruchus analis]
MQMISDSESDPFCDSGPSYVPGSSEDGSTSLEDMFISQKEPEIQTSEIQNVSSRNQKRGTRRKYRDETKWKRNVRKKQRNSGQEYTNAKGKVLKVSDGRLSRALKGLQDNGVPSTDKRGKKAPYNKTSPAKVEEVKAFIERFPKYQSHYSRQKNPNKQYLAPTLNISILYNLYKNEHENFVSKRVFTEVFKKNFNLSFHAPISDSCKTYDTLEQKIKDTADGDERRRLEIEREVHLRKAEAARVSMKSDAEFAKDVNNDLTVIAFDLMSTLPTPHLSTGICYYKRQLWTYCFNINNLSTGDSYMYIWDESKASRGPAEIGT